MPNDNNKLFRSNIEKLKNVKEDLDNSYDHSHQILLDVDNVKRLDAAKCCVEAAIKCLQSIW